MSKFYEMLNGASDDLLMESFEAVNVTAVKIDAIEEFVQESADVEILTEGIVDKIKSAASYVWDKIKAFFKACRDYMKSAWNWVVKKFNAAKAYLKDKFSKKEKTVAEVKKDEPATPEQASAKAAVVKADEKVKAATTPAEKEKAQAEVDSALANYNKLLEKNMAIKTKTLKDMVTFGSLDKVASMVEQNISKVAKVSDTYVNAGGSEEAKKRYQAAVNDLSKQTTAQINTHADLIRYLNYESIVIDLSKTDDVKKRIDEAEKRINAVEKSVLAMEKRYNDIVKQIEAGNESGVTAASIKNLVTRYVIRPSVNVCQVMSYDVNKLVKAFAIAIGTPKQEVVNGIKVNMSVPV